MREKNKVKGQGATEYLLMLAAVLVIVAVAIYYVTRAGGYPAVAMNAANDGDNGIKISVLSGSIAAGEWAYSVSATEGSYSWTTGTEALDAPSVSIGTYAAGTWFVNVKHLDSGHMYFSSDQTVTLPSP